MAARQLQKADEVSEMLVGRFYQVAHVRIQNIDSCRPIEELPVIPILHDDDKVFGIHVGKHYHIDGRFVPQTSAITKEWQLKNGQSWVVIDERHHKISEVFYKKLKCVRLSAGIPPVYFNGSILGWRDSMAGKSCKGRKCPHFGTTMNEVGGRLVCPMHGLVGDIEKEIIIMQTTYARQ